MLIFRSGYFRGGYFLKKFLSRFKQRDFMVGHTTPFHALEYEHEVCCRRWGSGQHGKSAALEIHT